jgi:hypothetical protein
MHNVVLDRPADLQGLDDISSTAWPMTFGADSICIHGWTSANQIEIVEYDFEMFVDVFRARTSRQYVGWQVKPATGKVVSHRDKIPN